MSSLRDFIKNNRVLIVMIPAIIGIHVGWNMVQNNEIFVDEKDRKELPIVVVSFNSFSFFYSYKPTDSK